MGDWLTGWAWKWCGAFRQQGFCFLAEERSRTARLQGLRAFLSDLRMNDCPSVGRLGRWGRGRGFRVGGSIAFIDPNWGDER